MSVLLSLPFFIASARPPGIVDIEPAQRIGPYAGWVGLAFILIVVGTLGFVLLNQRRRKHQYPSWPAFWYWIVVRVYARLVHRTRITGLEHIPDEGPVLLVSNHTGSADPFLLIAYVPRLIRWIMVRNTSLTWASFVTDAGGTIYINQDGRDLEGTRQAIRALKDGGMVGIFPEGGIERPPETLLPFMPGVGLLIRRAKPTVVPAWISGTPKIDDALDALKRFSHARIEIGEPIEFSDEELASAEAITVALRRRLHEMSGWPYLEDVEPTLNEDATGESSGRTTMSDS